MDDWWIERLDRSYQRGDFDCGQAALDDFLRTLVSQYEKRRRGQTYVAACPGDRRVLGYYTLAAGSLPIAQRPAAVAWKLPKHPIPVVRRARLAADRSAQGCGLGEALLRDTLGRCRDKADRLGIHAVEVDAIDEPAKTYYRRRPIIGSTDSSPSGMMNTIFISRWLRFDTPSGRVRALASREGPHR
jgi:GNAT superfamily N-acetyltransferase